MVPSKNDMNLMNMALYPFGAGIVEYLVEFLCEEARSGLNIFRFCAASVCNLGCIDTVILNEVFDFYIRKIPYKKFCIC